MRVYVCVCVLVRERAGEQEREDYLRGRVANPHSRGDTDTESSRSGKQNSAIPDIKIPQLEAIRVNEVLLSDQTLSCELRYT